jgi:DHA2 family multidrug resistance protein
MAVAEAALPEKASVRAWVAVAAGSVGAAMVTLDSSIVLSSLPQIQGEIGATLSEGTWIMTGYLAAEIVVIPISAWLIRLFGLRNLVVSGAVLFVTFSVLCALSTSLIQMIVFRVAQGLTGAVLIPSAHTIILSLLPRHEQMKGMSLFGAGSMVTPALGPVLGGWITDHMGWPFLFLLNIPLGIVLIGLLFASLDRDPPRTDPGATDWVGLVCLTIALACLTIVLEEGQRESWFESELITRLTVISAVSFAVFLYAELRHETPVVRLTLLRERSFSASLVVSFAFGAILYFAVYITPVFLGTIAHYDSQQIGFAMISLNAASMVMMPLTPAVEKRLGPRVTIAVGLAIIGVSCLINTDLTGDTGSDELILPHILRGASQPLIFLPLTQVATARIRLENIADASGLFNMTRNLGGSTGLALTAVILDRRSIFHTERLSEHISGNSHIAHDWIRGLGARLGSAAADVARGHAQALDAIHLLVQRQGLIMAYADALFLFGAGMLLSISMVLLLERPGAASPAGH